MMAFLEDALTGADDLMVSVRAPDSILQDCVGVLTHARDDALDDFYCLFLVPLMSCHVAPPVRLLVGTLHSRDQQVEYILDKYSIRLFLKCAFFNT
jgi:hypothetical protein